MSFVAVSALSFFPVDHLLTGGTETSGVHYSNCCPISV